MDVKLALRAADAAFREGVAVCVQIEIYLRNEEAPLEEIESILESYRAHSGAHADAYGYADYPNWQELFLAEKIRIRHEKLRAWKAHLLELKNDQN